MAVPDFQTIMFPMLEMLADGNEYSLAQMMHRLGSDFSLSENDLAERIPSGRQTKFYNRICWSTTHLKKAGLIQNVGRGSFKILPRGLEIFNRGLRRVDMKLLASFPEYLEFQKVGGTKSTSDDTRSIPLVESERTPDEILDEAYQEIRESLAADILDNVKKCSPSFFEQLVVDLLVRMGYGGTLDDAGQAVGRSGDGGIDGIIKEDRLGLDVIYLQAKRWEGTVSRPEIQKFAGALQGKRARKGVFITTSDYSKEAREFASGLDNKIILIDGPELASYMIDFNIGVSVVGSYEVKRIDSDYFVAE